MTTIEVFVDDKSIGSFDTTNPIGTAPANHLIEEVIEYLKSEHHIYITVSPGIAPI